MRKQRRSPNRRLNRVIAVPSGRPRPADHETTSRKDPMSSLPRISHRLFVAAVGNDAAEHEKSNSFPASAADADKDPGTMALEVLDCTTPLPLAGARPLRASVSFGAG